MTWLLLVVGVVGFIEALLLLPFRRLLGELAATAVKAGKTVRSQAISDHWKEKALLAYAARILRNSVALLLVLACACLPMALVIVIATGAGWPLWQLANSASGIVAATLAGIAYYRLRRHVAG